MKKILNFLIAIGKLKNKERRGWIVHQIKNPETTAEHIFHLAILVWVLGEKKKLNIERAIKMALIHDLCEVYAPDLIPLDALLFKNRKRPSLKKILTSKPKVGYPTIKEKERLAKFKQAMEEKAFKKLLFDFPADLREEMEGLFEEYNEGFTGVARFVKQAECLINFLQATEYWKRYKQIPYRLWVRWAKESIDAPVLLDFLKILENKFYKNKNESCD
jgi:putative hydrolase of HD superfamily